MNNLVKRVALGGVRFFAGRSRPASLPALSSSAVCLRCARSPQWHSAPLEAPGNTAAGRESLTLQPRRGQAAVGPADRQKS
jgi:hypothetical protein